MATPSEASDVDPDVEPPRDDEIGNFNPLDVYGWDPMTTSYNAQVIKVQYHAIAITFRRIEDQHSSLIPYLMIHLNRARQIVLEPRTFEHMRQQVL